MRKWLAFVGVFLCVAILIESSHRVNGAYDEGPDPMSPQKVARYIEGPGPITVSKA